jgi:hypothetical protein
LTVARYVEGVLLLFIALVPLHTASYLWRSRLLAEWTGAPARLAEIMTDLTAVVLVSEILGSVNEYRVGPIIVVLAALGIIASWAARHDSAWNQLPAKAEPRPVPGTGMRLANVAALVASSIVVAEWSTETVSAYHHGMLSIDTLWYHMPLAARFVQDSSITALHYTDSQPITPFYPASSELFHSLGILTMGNDVLSPLLNMLWLGIALLASWCIGRPFGVAPVSLTGCSILFGTPGLVATQPGGAYDDVVGLALLLSSIALLVNSRLLSNQSRAVAWAVAAAAAGLAVGTKVTFIAPAAALTVGSWFLAPRGRRVRYLSVWLLSLVATGVFWYGRNFFAIGNPLPPLHFQLGPLSLPSPQSMLPTSTVAHFLFDSNAWNAYFIPGLRMSFGPAWWILLSCSLLGLVLAVATGDRVRRVLGLVGLVAGVAFLVSPQYLTILGVPVFFTANVRYADGAVILGLVLLPTNPVLAKWRRSRWVLLGYLAILLTTQLDGAVWPTTLFAPHFEPPVQGWDSAIGLLVGIAVFVTGSIVLLYRAGVSFHLSRAAWIALGAMLVIGGFPIQQAYLQHRYISPPDGGNVSLPFFAWFQHVENARIGIIGQLTYLQYPLYGAADSNYVQYLGIRGPHGTFTTFVSCRAWREQIVNQRYKFVLIGTTTVRNRGSGDSSDASPETKWMGAGSASTIVFTTVSKSSRFMQSQLPDVRYTLYRVGPRFTAKSCEG